MTALSAPAQKSSVDRPPKPYPDFPLSTAPPPLPIEFGCRVGMA
jgi:hypothetical protein